MKSTASCVFRFLEKVESLHWERYVFWQNDFNSIRTALFSIANLLHDSNENSGEAISKMARICLRPWLSGPRSFDQSLTDELDEIDKFGITSNRWGSDVMSLYVSATRSAEKLKSIENPLQKSFIEELSRIVHSGYSFSIYCRNNQLEWFKPIMQKITGGNAVDHMFVHTVAQYRKMEPVEFLFRVGPLKTSGYSCTPDAFISAPRFKNLIQFVWCGCNDDSDFGFDPSSPSSSEENALGHRIRKNFRLHKIGKNENEEINRIEIPDEFQKSGVESGAMPAWLVTLPSNQGILYRPRQQVLSFEINTGRFERRTPFETLQPGMFIIQTDFESVDLGGSMKAGDYARAWKEKLKHEHKIDTDGFEKKLVDKGLILRKLPDSIKRWYSCVESILPAPGEMKHFDILINTLHECGLNSEVTNKSLSDEWKNLAWKEIKQARGEAISEGFQEVEMIEEQIQIILSQQHEKIIEDAKKENIFRLQISENNGLCGEIKFYQILSIEDGYLIPDEKLNAIQELNTIETWRD